MMNSRDHQCDFIPALWRKIMLSSKTYQLKRTSTRPLLSRFMPINSDITARFAGMNLLLHGGGKDNHRNGRLIDKRSVIEWHPGYKDDNLLQRVEKSPLFKAPIAVLHIEIERG
ncbi:hypothetical protein BJ165DRAFT_1400003 [Panaeolus papilionaceus]|nr:hypothetical protein BJ165DRAFT_1400003 [Panaeolus papilionaceus]